MATTFEFWIALFLIKKTVISWSKFYILDHFHVNLLIVIIPWTILAFFEDFGTFKKSKMAAVWE